MFQLGTLYTIFCNDISIITNYLINVNVLLMKLVEQLLKTLRILNIYYLLEISLSILSVTNKTKKEDLGN